MNRSQTLIVVPRSWNNFQFSGDKVADFRQYQPEKFDAKWATLVQALRVRPEKIFIAEDRFDHRFFRGPKFFKVRSKSDDPVEDVPATMLIEPEHFASLLKEDMNSYISVALFKEGVFYVDESDMIRTYVEY